MKRCPTCGHNLTAKPCPHCLAAESRRHARLVELRDECRAVQARISAQLSGLEAPQDVLDGLWQSSRLLSATVLKLGELTKRGVKK